jgi:hypothetical protein
MFFGYGKTICPSCYEGEQPFLFFDDDYWLNRFMARLLQHRGEPAPIIKTSSPQLYETGDEIEVIG